MLPTLNIIGAGHLGKTLGRLWAESGTLRIGQVLNSTPASTNAAIDFIGAGRPAGSITELDPAELTLIATPDDRIAGACAALVDSDRLSPGSVVFHCSGALASNALEAARKSGALAASVHPVRSFAEPDRVAADFIGTLCGVEGDAPALALLAGCFEAIGARFVAIDPGHKVLYHAAAVFACNYLVTLQDVARQTYAGAGVAPELALQLMEPLVRETIDNIFSKGPARALSGPIARGDLATVDRQQQALAQWHPEYAALYATFAELTKALATRRPAAA